MTMMIGKHGFTLELPGKNPKPCECARCVRACKQTPGWFKPGEAEKVAEYLKLDWETFRDKFLIMDHCDNHSAPDAPYVWSPRKLSDGEGSRYRSWMAQRTEGTCVFLKDDLCSIHEVKPYECRETMACDLRRGIRDEVEQAWIAAGVPLGWFEDQDPR